MGLAGCLYSSQSARDIEKFVPNPGNFHFHRRIADVFPCELKELRLLKSEWENEWIALSLSAAEPWNGGIGCRPQFSLLLIVVVAPSKLLRLHTTATWAQSAVCRRRHSTPRLWPRNSQWKCETHSINCATWNSEATHRRQATTAALRIHLFEHKSRKSRSYRKVASFYRCSAAVSIMNIYIVQKKANELWLSSLINTSGICQLNGSQIQNPTKSNFRWCSIRRVRWSGWNAFFSEKKLIFLGEKNARDFALLLLVFLFPPPLLASNPQFVLI